MKKLTMIACLMLSNLAVPSLPAVAPPVAAAWATASGAGMPATANYSPWVIALAIGRAPGSTTTMPVRGVCASNWAITSRSIARREPAPPTARKLRLGLIRQSWAGLPAATRFMGRTATLTPPSRAAPSNVSSPASVCAVSLRGPRFPPGHWDNMPEFLKP